MVIYGVWIAESENPTFSFIDVRSKSARSCTVKAERPCGVPGSSSKQNGTAAAAAAALSTG